jgi:hypothetical protein
MTKKRKKSMKKINKPHKDVHHFTMLLKYTERNIKNDGSFLDDYFKNQADRLKKQLKGLK